MTDAGGKLTLLGHLQELRRRLIRVVIAVVITTTLTSVFHQCIFYILILPAQGINLIFTEMTEMLGTTMKVCLASGLILAMPYITLQVIMFIQPALPSREKKYLYVVMPWVAIMFIGGVVFGYFVL